eukprot:TRINITY_DN3495_c0_g1::TRINITY_DN3495_c0_g1_i1::g.20521::m.20521 TRINITY_DN3495_c0_g1::TRINITY_DN3495_c0_g1_i1::g.20521  ORF type:complete len:196 (-),score=29.63 TRINITY_DN3495_c0_g1_i1:28-528(-)
MGQKGSFLPNGTNISMNNSALLDLSDSESVREWPNDKILASTPTVDLIMRAKAELKNAPPLLRVKAGKKLLMYLQRHLAGIQRDMDEIRRYRQPAPVVQKIWVCGLTLINVLPTSELKKAGTFELEGWAQVLKKMKACEQVILQRLERFDPLVPKEMRAEEKYAKR